MAQGKSPNNGPETDPALQRHVDDPGKARFENRLDAPVEEQVEDTQTRANIHHGGRHSEGEGLLSEGGVDVPVSPTSGEEGVVGNTLSDSAQTAQNDPASASVDTTVMPAPHSSEEQGGRGPVSSGATQQALNFPDGEPVDSPPVIIEATPLEATTAAVAPSSTLRLTLPRSGASPADIEITPVLIEEDQTIRLDVAVTSTDLNDSLTVIIDDLPEGATLNAGEQLAVGRWSLTLDDLDGLILNLPENMHGEFLLNVTVTAEDILGETVSVQADLPLTIFNVNDTPVTVNDTATTTEDTSVTIDVLSNDSDIDGDSLTITSASAEHGTVEIIDGELRYTPDADYNGADSISYTVSDGNGGTSSASVSVTVDAVADNPTLSVTSEVTSGAGEEIVGTSSSETLRGTAGADYIVGGRGHDTIYGEGGEDSGSQTHSIDIAAALEDIDGSETLTVTVTGVPEGVSLSAGTEISDGVWALGQDDLSGLELTVPTGTENFDLNIVAQSQENSNHDTATQSQTISISAESASDNDVIHGGEHNDTMYGGAGDDTFTVGQGDGYDSFIGGEGTDRVVATEDGTTIGINRTFNADNGVEEISADGHSDVNITGTTSSDNLDFSATTLTGIGEIRGGSGHDRITGTDQDDVIDGGQHNDTLSGGAGDDVIDGGSGRDTVDGGAGDDEGRLTFGEGQEDVYDGGLGTDTLRITVTEEDLTNPDVVADLVALQNFITENADATSENGSSQTFQHLGVTVSDWEALQVVDEDGNAFDLQASLPSVNAEDVSGVENTAIDLDLSASLTDTDGSESLTLNIADIPEGAVLTDGSHSFTADADTQSVDITGWDQSSLQITPPTDFEGQINLTVTATATESLGGETATNTDNFTVEVNPEVQHFYGSSGANDIDGSDGDDVLHYSDDANWSGRYQAHNVETGERVRLGGKNRTHDVYDGDEGYDVLQGTDGHDALFLDDGISPFESGQQARIQNIEEIDMGDGHDILDMTSNQYDYDQGVIAKGGAGHDTLWTSTGDDTLIGGSGHDSMFGGDGNDLFIFSADEGHDTVAGGTGWTDVIDLQGFEGMNAEQGWTLTIDGADIQSVDNEAGEMLLAEDASGTINFDGGGEINFEGIEKITW